MRNKINLITTQILILAMMFMISSVITPIQVYSQDNETEKGNFAGKKVDKQLSNRQIRIKERKEKAQTYRAELDLKNEVEGLGLGFEMLEPLIKMADPLGISAPLNLIVSYGYMWNFEALLVSKTIFPDRGGFSNTTSMGLRIHSSRKYGSSLFFGLSTGWTLTNVPWLDNGFEMEAYGGYRYLFKFRMYLDGGGGGRFKITAGKMEPLFFISLGYII